MYKLENNVEWTDDLKNAFKHGVTKGKIVYKEDNVISGQGESVSLNGISESKNIYSSVLELGNIDTTTGINVSSSNCIRSKDYIRVEPETTYTIQNNNLYQEVLYFYDGSKTFISASSKSKGTVTFTTPANCYYLRNRTAVGDIENDLTTKFQLELGIVATSYEPYENRFVKFGIKGNRKQETYEGKNIVDFSNLTNVANATASFQNNVLTLVGSSARYSYVRYYLLSFLKQHAGETLNFDYENIAIDGTRYGNVVQLRMTDENGNMTYPVLLKANLTKQTYTIPDDIANYTDAQIQIYCNNDSTRDSACTLTIKKPMLYLGTAIPEYEPYVGAQPSPNPSYPQEIYAVGDNVTVNVNINNKNLLDISKFQENYNLNSNGLPVYVPNTYRVANTTPIDVSNFENVTLSFINKTTGTIYFIYSLLDKDNNLIKRQAGNSNGATINTLGAKYMYICFYDNVTISSIANVQLELGSTVTAYTPHQHQTYTIPCQQPMVAEEDYFDWDNEKEIHGWEKYEITGNESSSIGGTNFATMYNNGNIMRILTLNDMLATSTTNDVFSNCLTTTTDTLWNGVKSGIQSGANTKRVAISVPISNIETYLGETLTEQNYISAFFQYLHSIGCYIIYKLATPEELAFTTAQKTVANQIKNATSYPEQTNIYSTDNVSPKFDIEAYEAENVEINHDNGLKEITIEDNVYVPDMGFIGQAPAKKATVTLLDNEQITNLENKEFKIYIGADYNNQTYYINYGKFIVNEPPENDSTNGTIKIIAYDYMIKFNKIYEDQVTYPITLKKYLINICKQAGIILGSESFTNDSFMVTDNQFEGKQLRDVLKHIGKSAFSWVRIGQDNKLYLDFEATGTSVETFGIDDYKLDGYKKANEYYGPINKVTYGDSDIQGQELSVPTVDPENVKELVINDNYFGYTLAKRQELIQNGTVLFGFTYMPVSKLDLTGAIYLDCTDTIKVKDEENNEIITRVFSHTIKYNGIVSDTVAAEGISDNQQTYENMNTPVSTINRAEISVNRANKKIQSVVSEIGDRSQKTTTITQDIDGISSEVSAVEIKADNAQSTADGINTNLTNNYYTKTETNSAITQKANEITSTVSQTYSTKTETANAINGIKIGGNNLISNNADNWQSGNWSIPSVGGKTTIQSFANRISLKQKIEIEPNTDYWIKIYSSKQNINALFRVCDSDDNFLRSVTDLKDQKWTSEANDKYIHITVYNNSTISDIENGITKIKIEKGNKATDWSPSLSDYSTTTQMNSAITQKANEINLRIDEIENLTNEIEGTKTITLQNCVEGSLLELHIYGNNSVFDYLYPADNLYPSNTLYPYGDSRIEVTDENNNTVTYELGVMDKLRQNGNVKDEYILEKEQAKVIRRINTDGTVKSQETVEDLGEYFIRLANGTNTIKIKNYSATLKAKFAIQNDFTDVFATKAEMNSSITQTAEEINLEVSKKVDENEVISKINQSAEQVQINANKISLARKRN